MQLRRKHGLTTHKGSCLPSLLQRTALHRGYYYLVYRLFCTALRISISLQCTGILFHTKAHVCYIHCTGLQWSINCTACAALLKTFVSTGDSPPLQSYHFALVQLHFASYITATTALHWCSVHWYVLPASTTASATAILLQSTEWLVSSVTHLPQPC